MGGRCLWGLGTKRVEVAAGSCCSRCRLTWQRAASFRDSWTPKECKTTATTKTTTATERVHVPDTEIPGSKYYTYYGFLDLIPSHLGTWTLSSGPLPHPKSRLKAPIGCPRANEGRLPGSRSPSPSMNLHVGIHMYTYYINVQNMYRWIHIAPSTET